MGYFWELDAGRDVKLHDRRRKSASLYDLTIGTIEDSLVEHGFKGEDLAFYIKRLAESKIASFFGTNDPSSEIIYRCLRDSAQCIGDMVGMGRHGRVEIVGSDGVLRFRSAHRYLFGSKRFFGEGVAENPRFSGSVDSVILGYTHCDMDRVMDEARELDLDNSVPDHLPVSPKSGLYLAVLVLNRYPDGAESIAHPIQYRMRIA